MHAVGGCLRMHVCVFSCENVITLVDGVCLFAQIFDCTFFTSVKEMGIIEMCVV